MPLANTAGDSVAMSTSLALRLAQVGCGNHLRPMSQQQSAPPHDAFLANFGVTSRRVSHRMRYGCFGEPLTSQLMDTPLSSVNSTTRRRFLVRPLNTTVASTPRVSSEMNLQRSLGGAAAAASSSSDPNTISSQKFGVLRTSLTSSPPSSSLHRTFDFRRGSPPSSQPLPELSLLLLLPERHVVHDELRDAVDPTRSAFTSLSARDTSFMSIMLLLMLLCVSASMLLLAVTGAGSARGSKVRRDRAKKISRFAQAPKKPQR